MAFTLRQLQYFIAVAEQGTVSGAAQSLSISQSAATDAIKNLETDLGVSLFERHRRGLSITRNRDYLSTGASGRLPQSVQEPSYTATSLAPAT